MNNIVISIGSNHRDRDLYVEQCIDFLRQRFSDVRVSATYSTPADNGRDADYLNAVMAGQCTDDYDRTKALLKLYETAHGRTPLSKALGVVTIDLDIVMWNGEVLRQRDFDQKYFQIGWKQLQR